MEISRGELVSLNSGIAELKIAEFNLDIINNICNLKEILESKVNQISKAQYKLFEELGARKVGNEFTIKIDEEIKGKEIQDKVNEFMLYKIKIDDKYFNFIPNDELIKSCKASNISIEMLVLLRKFLTSK